MSKQLSDAVVLERLAEGLKSMPALPRVVFVRHRFDEASYAEIAAERRITIAEVEGNIAAAILHLHRAVWT